MDTSCANFKFMQAERLNIFTVTSNTYLSTDMSGSTIIADIRNNDIELFLPKPESGLNFKIIIKASSDNNGQKNRLIIRGTSDDVTSNSIINFLGMSTEELNNESVPSKTNSEFKTLNILSGTQIHSLYFGSPFLHQPAADQLTTINFSDTGAANNLYNTTGDFVELICDGTEWYANGMSKNRSIYKMINTNAGVQFSFTY